MVGRYAHVRLDQPGRPGSRGLAGERLRGHQRAVRGQFRGPRRGRDHRLCVPAAQGGGHGRPRGPRRTQDLYDVADGPRDRRIGQHGRRRLCSAGRWPYAGRCRDDCRGDGRGLPRRARSRRQAPGRGRGQGLAHPDGEAGAGRGGSGDWSPQRGASYAGRQDGYFQGRSPWRHQAALGRWARFAPHTAERHKYRREAQRAFIPMWGQPSRWTPSTTDGHQVTYRDREAESTGARFGK